MRRGLRWGARGALVLVVLALAAGLWKRDEILRLMAVNSLFAENRIVANFSSMDQMFLTREMTAGTPAPLPQGPSAEMPPGFDDWLAARNVTAYVVLKDGQIVAEDYLLGTRAEDLRISWSVAKGALSLLYGILLKEGEVPDLDTLVTETVPALRGSAYDGARIRDVLTMSSGIAFNEDYLDYKSDINRMGRVLALGRSMDDFAAGQDARAADPGTRWQYVSIDTHVLGMVIRAATGRPVPGLLEARLFVPMGLERAPYYLIDGHGVAFVLGGLNLTTRDFARLGLLVAQGGAWQGRQLVPADWVAESIRPQAPDGAPYGYQWWVPEGAGRGEVLARGIYGQYVYIDSARDVVIAVNAADRQFRAPGVGAGNLAMFRAIAHGP
ncbi:MAG: serine hydrolase [Rhodobacteraceae bacterium]|nr:serine hydrolase [Paracoccaceae bacterium]